jgi:hypothetical protein
METSIIQFQNFIIATRDSGYKSTASALAELVDNAIEACATKIEIQIAKLEDAEEQYEVYVIDNGKGMSQHELNLALQFGGSSRFNSRNQLGRYGMGLPNSSLSQCRRIEVNTWKDKDSILFNYLDVDEVIDKRLTRLQLPKKLKQTFIPIQSKSGTIVRWKKCDRLSFKYLKNLVKHIQFELGRIFRYAIWRGVKIYVCGELVIPFDPLFINAKGLNLVGGTMFGKELTYPVKVPGNEKRTSEIRVKFVELPVQTWSKLPNEEKRKNLITKCAGVSVLRAEREIDYGWFFMGEKRKENYDDWWRCEISFLPDLDEVFGVTHTKQEIKQTEFLNGILIPDIEQISRQLNNRVRLKFIELKKSQPNLYSKQQLENGDVYLPGLKTEKGKAKEKRKWKGMEYEIVATELEKNIFFDVKKDKSKVILQVNKSHIFYHKIFKSLHDKMVNSTTEFIKILEILIFAAARSELLFVESKEKQVISRFKYEWSSNIKTFMS